MPLVARPMMALSTVKQVLTSVARAAGSIRRLIRHLWDESPMLVVIGTCSAIGQSALFIPVALVIRHVFNVQIPHRHAGPIIASGVLVIALYAASAVLAYMSRVAALRITTGVITQIRLDLLSKLYSLPQRWRDRQRVGTVHALAVQDTERVEGMLVEITSVALPAAVSGVALTVLAAVVNPTLFLVLLAVVAPLMLGVRLLARRARRLANHWAQSSRRFSAEMQLLLRAMSLTKVVGGEAWELQRTSERVGELSERYRAFGVASAAASALENGVAAVAGSVVLVVGGIAVARHTMSLGSLLAFYAVLALLLRQIHSVGWQTHSILVGLQSMTRVEALLHLDEKEPYGLGNRVLDFRGGVVLDGVCFAYEDLPVLRDIDLTIRPAERVAIIGPNGAGKSTLVSLILGLYEPERGRLRADGVPYEELDMRRLRRRLGVVVQDPVLSPGTIRDNIAYASREASDAAVRAAATAATAAEFVEALPDAYQTVVGDEGIGLSGGQRQRVAIARALLGAPALLILDEPTTYLDEAAVAALMTRLAALPQAPTVVFVTHDPHVAVHVDRVIELRDGRIVSDSGAAPTLATAAT